MKFSIIIPTIWKSDKIYALLKSLEQEDLVDEIILIDNSKEYHKNINLDFKKIVLVQPKENLYVNPSWNLGVKISKNNLLCICNDDIVFNTNIFDFILNEQSTLGIIGQAKQNYTSKNINNYKIEEISLRDWGWGCLFFLNKNDWIEIPENLKIWCGDDFIFEKNKAKKYAIKNFLIETHMSSSSDLKEFDPIKEQDVLEYKKIL